MADNENVSAIPEEPHFRLLDLPVEVRRMILRYFLVKKERIFLAYRTQRVNFRELIFHLQPAGDLHAGLLRTSRQLAVEGLRTLYGENTFTFGCKGVWLSESRYKPCQPIFFVTAVGYDNAKLVRSVYCDPYCARFLDEKDMELYPVETTMEYHDEAARAIDDVLKSFHGLRTLTIDFSRCTAALTKTSVVVLMLLKLPLQELQSLDIKGLADEELENFIKTEALEHVDQLTRKFKSVTPRSRLALV